MSITITLTVSSAELAKQLIDIAAGSTAAPEIPAPFALPASPPAGAPVSAPAATAPASGAATPAPTAAAPAYDFNTLANAASPLMLAGRGPELTALLSTFGVRAMTELPPDRYGEFATALRGMGAKL